MEAKNIHSKKANMQSWNNNTHLCVNLKTQLRSDRQVKAGKSYQGVLRRDVICEDFLYDDHFTFTETILTTREKRNPHVFEGQFITATGRDDGSLRLNFRPLPTGEGFNLERYAIGVFNEILWALEGRVEEG